uniref:Uncharacterized protein n=1 Tax=Anguilla anguilla TaxID=7936 RepID=A0A0E9Q8B6_ANGAN
MLSGDSLDCSPPSLHVSTSTCITR